MAIKGEDVGLYLVSQDVIIPDCNIIITQPIIKEVLLFGETNFLQAIQYISKTADCFEEVRLIDKQLQMLDDFQLFLFVYRNEPIIKGVIKDFFDLVFPKYNVKVTDNTIDFIDEDEIKGRITPFNFRQLQDICINLFIPLLQQEVQYNPTSKKAQEIAEKLKKGREEKARRESKTTGNQSLFGTYLSILAVGLGIPIYSLADCTIFQLNDMFLRFNAKMQWDQYIKMATIPFSDASKLEEPDIWTSDLYK